MNAITSGESMDRFKLSPSEIKTMDKKNAAFHEAGHAVVALSLNAAYVRANLQRNDSGDPHEVTWVGWCSYGLTDPESCAIIGSAGLVTEAISREEWDGPWSICEWDLSDSDRKSIGDHCFDTVAEKAHEILTERWDLVAKIASRLISQEILTDGMILEIINQPEGNQ